MSIEILPSANDVIAVRLQGKLAHEELERLIDLIERSLSEHDLTHVFVEDIGFTGIEMQHLPQYLQRARPLLFKLKRFGRIAVVSDQAWVRNAARFESAFMPKISYETFAASEREHALAWVEGREPLSRQG